MAYEVEVKELPAQLALTVRKRATMASLGAMMGEAFTAIGACAEGGAARYAGPPFALYPSQVTAEFDVVVCMPVQQGASACHDVRLEEIQGGTVVSTTHTGPYSGLGSAYGALQAWMVANGKKPHDPCREVYLNEPGSVQDDELVTEVAWPFV